jgi:hypothetical protein
MRSIKQSIDPLGIMNPVRFAARRRWSSLREFPPPTSALADARREQSGLAIGSNSAGGRCKIRILNQE